MVNTEHPAVDRVRAALAEHGLEPEITWFETATPTAQAAAEAIGCDVGAIANSLVFALDGEPVLVMTSGAHRVDTEFLGARLGGRLTRASKDQVKDATGQTIGGVAPVGHPSPVPTFVDVALSAYPRIWGAAGHAHTVFPLSYAELLRITDGTEVEVAPPQSEA
ncbi:YbaK/EbsC family protein [Gryllotalpicola ginsengisoli]|uniref:YbaK/EbsC family protein n=1 Tax=Gryllotalpicola ginsengisoli TaxID=444608 RepID=UPI0004215CCE|nr:YbaK/EbsC family protein [Gryllotalpicola ginsengisoli]